MSEKEYTSEPDTIPAARPGLPRIQRGAEGPLRTDEHLRKADPSIRDTHPLTVNGLWETPPGNSIAQPRPEQQDIGANGKGDGNGKKQK